MWFPANPTGAANLCLSMSWLIKTAAGAGCGCDDTGADGDGAAVAGVAEVGDGGAGGTANVSRGGGGGGGGGVGAVDSVSACRKFASAQSPPERSIMAVSSVRVSLGPAIGRPSSSQLISCSTW